MFDTKNKKCSVNFNSKLPLRYYNNLADSLSEKELGIHVDTRQEQLMAAIPGSESLTVLFISVAISAVISSIQTP